jgi:uncharacterized membrane protein
LATLARATRMRAQAKKTVEKLRAIDLDSVERSLGTKFLRRERGELLIYALIISYTLVFSWQAVLQYSSFHTLAWDLGIYNQAMWTTTHEGKLFYYTCELYYVPNGSFFGIHFSPILFLLVPIYALVTGPQTLLVAQSLILALGALPLYLLSKTKINRSVGIVLAACYLLYAPLQGVNGYDFHAQAFFPFLMLFSLYFLEKENWAGYFIFILLSLMVMEQVSYLVLFLGFYLLWTFKGRILSTFKNRKLHDKTVLVPFVTIALALIWFFVAQGVIHSLNPSPPSELKAGQNFVVLGVDEPMNIPLYILQNPGKAVNALSYDFFQKFLYVIFIFGPLAFLPFLSPAILVASLPWLGLALLSNYSPYYRLGFQYAALIVPFVFASAVFAMHKLLDGSILSGKTVRRVASLVLVCSILFSVAFSPISPLIQGNYPSPAYSIPDVSDHTRLLDQIIDLIPQNESIITQDNIFPHVSDRSNAYVVMPQIQGETDLWKRAASFILGLNTSFVLVDLKIDPYIGGILLSNTISKNEYGLYAYADKILLLKRSYSGKPVFFQPILLRYDYRSLQNTGEVLDDPASVTGKVLCHNATSPDQNAFWFGPYDSLPPGNFTVSFRLKVSAIIDEPIIDLDVLTQGTIIATTGLINSSNFTQANVWQNFTLQFELKRPVSDIEFRGMDVRNATDIYLDYIEVSARGSP